MPVRTRSRKSRFLAGRILALPLTLYFATTLLAESKYLTFQVSPAGSGHAGIPPLPGHLALSKGQMAEFVQSVVKAIGTTGDEQHKLGFAIGPLTFDMSDDETRQFIRDAFAVARETDVAVALHIDDSMSWGLRKDLLSNPDNIETADWKQIPSTGRRLAWGPTPTRVPPHMCYNARAIVAAAKDRAKLIGTEIKREMAVLRAAGKEHLFAAVIAGWETQIGRDFETDRPLGFRALANRGFSVKNPPKDLDAERVSVVKEWMELWANSLRAAGTPREKIFCHIAFTDQGLRKPDAKETYAQKVAFAVPEVAFSSAYRPGFSTYPEGRTFQELYAALAGHGSPGWISAEGTNVSPTSMPGEPTMETYLARIFNQGGVLVNLFSWGIGGEAYRNNFFRRATENSEALAAYAKFLRGGQLVESAAQGFSAAAFQEKMRRIQTAMPAWVQKTGRQAEAMSLAEKITALMKERKFEEADKVADEILSLISSTPAPQQPPGPPPATARQSLQQKMARLQALAQKHQEAGGDMQPIVEIADGVQPLLDQQKFREAEALVDRALKLLGETGTSGERPPAGNNKEPPIASTPGVKGIGYQVDVAAGNADFGIDLYQRSTVMVRNDLGLDYQFSDVTTPQTLTGLKGGRQRGNVQEPESRAGHRERRATSLRLAGYSANNGISPADEAPVTVPTRLSTKRGHSSTGGSRLRTCNSLERRLPLSAQVAWWHIRDSVMFAIFMKGQRGL